MSDYRLHIIDGYISNLYIAEYKDKMLLFDCGIKNDVERIKNFCEKKLNRSIKDIKLAVASHNHPDHSGGADLLRKVYGIPIASGKGIDLWYKGFSGFIQHKIDCLLAQFVRKTHGKNIQPVMFNRYVNPDHVLADEEFLPGFPDWKALYVPGHTLHDIVLYNEKNKFLYSSDCIINLNGRYNLPIPVFFPKIMKQSFERLMHYNIDTFAPAHGDMIHAKNSVIEIQKMIDLVFLPPNEMAKTVQAISVFTPPVWKASINKIKRRYQNR